jgi:hypothetical protein
MKQTPFALLLLASGVALFAGCITSEHGAYLPVNTTVNNLENVAGVVLLERAAQNSVTCPGIQETRLPDGRLQVEAQIRNRENRRLQVQIDSVFKDAQGFTVEETPFINLFLDENAQESARFVSANDKPVRYTIRIREAR